MGLMDGLEVHGLDLNEHFVVDVQVEAEGVFYMQIVEYDRQRFLTIDLVSKLTKLVSQTRLVYRLQQSGPDGP